MPDFRTIERELVEFFEASATVWYESGEPFMHAAEVVEDLTNRYGDRIKRGEDVSLTALAQRLTDLWK